MKPMNWISATGRRPAAAMPIEMPPIAPTSSPTITTVGSSLIARESAMVTAPIRVVSAMVASPAGGDSLLGVGRRQLRIEMIEHRFRRLWRRCQVALDRRVDLGIDLVDQPLLGTLGPRV